MGEIWSSISDLVLGRHCAGCQTPGILVCASCQAALAPRPRLRRSLDLGDVVADLRIPVACALDYRGAPRHVLYRYKDHRIRELARVLAPPLAHAITYAAHQAGMTAAALTVVPMPARRSTVRRRGFDHVAYLLSRATHEFQCAGVSRLLRDRRGPGSSKPMGLHERAESIAGAFELRQRPPMGPVMLVDDIVTTGTTAREAAATLILSGVHVVGVATAAGTP